MSFISDLFSSSKGAGFQAQGANPKDLKTAQNQTQQGIQQQQAFANAVAAQNGLGNQAQVYNQLQGVVNGTGPNPAQAMLNNATGQNVANQAALMASQRGASANPGMIARQAAQQGANIQQNAVGQGAALQAQQGLNALGQAGALAQNQVGQQQGALNSLNSAAQGNQGQLLGMQANVNNANAGIAAQNAKSQGAMVGGLLNGVGAAFGLAEGGEVPDVGPHMEAGLKSSAGKAFMAGFSKGMQGAKPMAKGGNVGSALKAGGKVPGQASVAGDSQKNDTVKAMLSPGEVVIPRSVMNSKDPSKEAAKFVAAVMAKQGAPSKRKK